jgi:hypothetical protein
MVRRSWTVHLGWDIRPGSRTVRLGWDIRPGSWRLVSDGIHARGHGRFVSDGTPAGGMGGSSRMDMRPGSWRFVSDGIHARGCAIRLGWDTGPVLRTVRVRWDIRPGSRYSAGHVAAPRPERRERAESGASPESVWPGGVSCTAVRGRIRRCGRPGHGGRYGRHRSVRPGGCSTGPSRFAAGSSRCDAGTRVSGNR